MKEFRTAIAEGNEDKFDAAMLVRRVICQCNSALKEIAG